jgi:hypothetical protein
MTGTTHEVWGVIKLRSKNFPAFSNKSFAQTSSIVLANIATWVLSTHVAIRGRDSPI